MSTVTNISTRGRRRNQPAAASREESRCAACSATGPSPAAIVHEYGCANYECPTCSMRAGNHVEGCETYAEIAAAVRAAVVSGTTGEVTTPPADAPPAKAPADEPGGAGDEPIEDEPDEDDDEGLDSIVEPDDEPDEPKAKRELTRVVPPAISADLVRDLQSALEERQLIAFAQPLTKAILCEETHIVGEVEVGCSGVAAVAIVDEKICSECAKMKRKRLLALCIAHGARYASGEAVDPQLAFQLEIA